MIYIGVDPGVNGALAWVDCDQLGGFDPMPQTDADLLDWFGDEPSFAVLEKVGGFIPGSGGNIGSAMFRFGANYGALRMALTAAQVPFVEKTPRVWQKALGIPAKGKNEDKAQFKRRLKEFAQRLFPDVSDISLKAADAILLAEYARRIYV